MKSGYQSNCKECQRKHTYNYYNKNKDAILAERKNPCSKAAVEAKLRKTRERLKKGINFAPVVYGGHNTI
jgi:hypothetical protein